MTSAITRIRIVAAALAIAVASGCGSGGAQDECACRNASDQEAKRPLSCLCGTATAPAECTAKPSTFDLASQCPSSLQVTRMTGCGKVVFQISGATFGSKYVFDASSGDLVGESAGGDVPSGMCSVFTYTYGDVEVSCPTASSCDVCRDPSGPSDLPRCQ